METNEILAIVDAFSWVVCAKRLGVIKRDVKYKFHGGSFERTGGAQKFIGEQGH